MSRALRFLPLFLPVFFGLTSCGKSRETCQRESADLAAMFKAMDTRMGIHTEFVKLAQRDELPIAPDELGVVLEVTEDGVRTFGVREPQGIDVVLPRVLENSRSEKLPRFLVAFDASTTWKNVYAVLHGLEVAGFTDVSLVFARKGVEMKPPPKSAIDAQLDAAEKALPSERAADVAKIASEVVKDCEAINTLFSSVSGTGDKAQMMIEGLPPALLACNCKCDVASLKSLMFRLLANRNPTTSVHVTLGGDETMELSGDALWSEVSKKMTPGRSFKAKLAN